MILIQQSCSPFIFQLSFRRVRIITIRVFLPDNPLLVMHDNFSLLVASNLYCCLPGLLLCTVQRSSSLIISSLYLPSS